METYKLHTFLQLKVFFCKINQNFTHWLLGTYPEQIELVWHCIYMRLYLNNSHIHIHHTYTIQPTFFFKYISSLARENFRQLLSERCDAALYICEYALLLSLPSINGHAHTCFCFSITKHPFL